MMYVFFFIEFDILYCNIHSKFIEDAYTVFELDYRFEKVILRTNVCSKRL